MGIPQPPHPVKLFVGMLSAEPDRLVMARRILESEFGPADLESPTWPWNYTGYYAREMGGPLWRKFVFFEREIPPGQLAGIKCLTNEFEKQTGAVIHDRLCRTVNLDPGYLSASQVVLATTKGFSHRIYLDAGIYAEVTLIYRGKRYEPLTYTYPDYCTAEYIELFNQAREAYRRIHP